MSVVTDGTYVLATAGLTSINLDNVTYSQRSLFEPLLREKSLVGTL